MKAIKLKKDLRIQGKMFATSIYYVDLMVYGL